MRLVKTDTFSGGRELRHLLSVKQLQAQLFGHSMTSGFVSSTLEVGGVDLKGERKLHLAWQKIARLIQGLSLSSFCLAEDSVLPALIATENLTP